MGRKDREERLWQLRRLKRRNDRRATHFAAQPFFLIELAQPCDQISQSLFGKAIETIKQNPGTWVVVQYSPPLKFLDPNSPMISINTMFYRVL